MKKLLLTAASFALAFGISQSASADTLYFTSCHITGGCGTGIDGAYGTVVLDQTATGVTVTATLYDGSFYVSTGALDNQYFVFNGPSNTAANYSDNSPLYQLNTAGYGMGNSTSFAYGIGQAPGSGNCTQLTCVGNTIQFSIAGATIAQLTTAVNGEIFLADANIAGNTGVIDVSTTPTVPDGGSTVMLLGSAFLALGALRRRFGRS